MGRGWLRGAKDLDKELAWALDLKSVCDQGKFLANRGAIRELEA